MKSDVAFQVLHRLRILSWGLGGEGVGGGVFDYDGVEVVGDGVQTEEIMIPLGWEHPSGCPPELYSAKSLADLLFGSLVAWPEVIVLAVPEHAAEHLQMGLAKDLASIFASRYPPSLLVLSGSPSVVTEFEANAPTPPHVERLREIEGVGGEGWTTVVYSSAPGWGAGSLLDNVNGEVPAQQIAGVARGRGCVLVGNGPSLNSMTDAENFNSSSSSRGHALRLLNEVSCVVGANKFWLGSAKFGFQPSIFVAQDVHVMQVTLFTVESRFWLAQSTSTQFPYLAASTITLIVCRLGCIACLICRGEC